MLWNTISLRWGSTVSLLVTDEKQAFKLVYEAPLMESLINVSLFISGTISGTEEDPLLALWIVLGILGLFVLFFIYFTCCWFWYDYSKGKDIIGCLQSCLSCCCCPFCPEWFRNLPDHIFGSDPDGELYIQSF